MIKFGDVDDYAIVCGCNSANVVSSCLKEMRKPRLCVFDIGANVGTVSISLGLLFRDRIKIHAVEPHPIIYDLLLKNISYHHLEDVITPHNVAVGSNQLYIGSGQPTANNTGVFRTSNVGGDGYTKVQNITLNDLITKSKVDHIDVLKMDIEGAEYNVFSDFTMWDCVSKYHIEYHDIPISEHHDFVKCGMVDEYFGLSLQKYIMSKLGLDYKNKQTRLI